MSNYNGPPRPLRRRVHLWDVCTSQPERRDVYAGCEVYLPPKELGSFEGELRRLPRRQELKISNMVFGWGGERVKLDLPISTDTPPYLPISPCISRYLPTSPQPSATRTRRTSLPTTASPRRRRRAHTHTHMHTHTHTHTHDTCTHAHQIRCARHRAPRDRQGVLTLTLTLTLTRSGSSRSLAAR